MRWLVRLFVAFAALLAVAIGGLWFYLDDATLSAIEQGGEAMLGVSTTVDRVSVRPVSGRVEFDGVQIANPDGFSEHPFFSLGEGRVELELASLLRDVVVLPLFSLSDIDLRLETRGRRANYDALIAGRASDPDAGAESSASDSQSGGLRVRIETVRIERVVAHIDAAVLGARRSATIEIPEIVLRDVGSGSEGGVPASELGEIVVDAVIAVLAKEGVSLPSLLVGSLASLPVELAGNLVHTAGELEQQMIDATGDAFGSGADAVEGGLGSLFGRGKQSE